jgi:hypothetical protein
MIDPNLGQVLVKKEIGGEIMMTKMNHFTKWSMLVNDYNILSSFDCQNFFAILRPRHKTLGIKNSPVVSTCFIHHFQEEL